MFIVILFCLSANPQIQEHVVNCDIIEFNHIYNTNGEHTLDQYIYYKWSQKDARFNVIGWKLDKKVSIIHTDRKLNFPHSQKFLELNKLIHIRSKQKKETWTMYDPEVVERDILPVEMREGINPPN